MQRTKLLTRKSNKYIYAQLVDPQSGRTLGSIRAKDPEIVGAEIAKKALKLKLSEAVFDRGRNKYHGQVKKLAESARKGGLKF